MRCCVFLGQPLYWNMINWEVVWDSWLLQQRCSSCCSCWWAWFCWLGNTSIEACSAWSLRTSGCLLRDTGDTWPHCSSWTNSNTIVQQLLPSPPKSLKKRDAYKEEVAKVVEWDVCGFRSHSWLLCDLGKAQTTVCNVKLRCTAFRFESSVWRVFVGYLALKSW